MSLQAAVGVAYGEDPEISGANACQEAVGQLGGGEPHLILVFASVRYDQNAVLLGVRSVAKNALIVGSSTAGEISTFGPTRRRSIVVMAIHSFDIKFFAGLGTDVKGNARKAGKMAGDEVKKQTTRVLNAFIMFSDILNANGADIVRGVLDSLGAHFPVVGGASGDDFEFKKTYQYLNERAYSGTVLGLGLAGNFKMGVGVKHGWVPIGNARKVTKSEGSVLHELDGQPAISIYDDYFGDEAKILRTDTLAKLAVTYPLGMKVAGSDEMLIRDPFTVDSTGSITCAAEIPEGAEIQLMIGSREQAVKVARQAAEKAMKDLDGTPKAVIIFNCIARSKLFGEQSGDEIKAIQEVVGEHTPLIGFYTYGEQAPLGGEVRNIKQCNSAFHNETVVIFILGE